MNRLRAFIAAAAALALALGAATDARAASCANAGAAGASVPATTAGDAVRCLVNAERTSRGLSALAPSARLRAAAAAHSADMIARRFFDHVSPGGATVTDRVRRAGYSGRTLGEDIGWGTAELGSPAAIVQAWMHSPPHRAVILSPRFREIGVGVALGTPTERTADGAVYVLDLGRR
jgi:uncharacterized protein YkwD